MKKRFGFILAAICLLAVLMSTAAFAAESGYRLNLNYDEDLCSISVIDPNDSNALVPNGGYLTKTSGGAASARFQIEDIAEGYRIKSVTFDGSDETKNWIVGIYGFMYRGRIANDVVMDVVLEKIPASLPTVESIRLYADEACTVPLSKDLTLDEPLYYVYVKGTYSDGKEYPMHTARGFMEYTVDGVNWDSTVWGGYYPYFPVTECQYEDKFDNTSTRYDSYDFRVRITPDDLYCTGGNVYSEVYHVNGGVSAGSAEKPAITAQPKSVTVTADAAASFSVEASGSELTYQWYYRTAPTGTWAKATAAGNTTAKLNLGTAGTARDGYEYRCAVSNGTDTVYSDTVKLYIKPKITAQSKSVSASAEDGVSFTVKATGANLKYQWQYKAPGYAWANNSCKSAKLIIDPAQSWRDGYQYRCVITGRSGLSVTSNAVTLSVSAAEKPVITKQPASVTAAASDAVSFTVKATGEGLSYQWQYKAPGYAWANNSCKSATLTIDPAQSWRDGYQYRCVVKNAGGSVTSGAATLTVPAVAKPVINLHPVDATAAPSEAVSFTVKATGEGLSYQWQYKAPGYGWTNNTCKSATLTISPAQSWRDGYQYRCVIKNAGGSVTTNTATLTVPDFSGGPIITQQPTDSITLFLDGATFVVKAIGEDLTYQWQHREPGGEWSNESCTNAVYSLDCEYSLHEDEYRCVITDAYGNQVTTDVVRLLILPVIYEDPTNVSTTANGTAVFSVSASGPDLHYRWQYKAPGYDWKDNTCTDATFTIAKPGTWRNGYQYRCIVSNSAGSEVSAIVKLTVK